MIDADYAVMTAEQLQEQVVARAAVDEDFRARFVEDPKKLVLDEYGIAMPDSVNVEVHENSADTVHVVLEANPALSEMELQGATGGSPPFVQPPPPPP